ncbi:MAG: leucine-rich repeat protein [Prevotellaceae bacterium]|jgi:uncharacterized repeat protein (TIGR02543 family)|nr:leucine-rich repeat protein [Prevotellaceae bacterium]
MKNIFTLTFAALCLLLAPKTAHAYDFTVDGIFYSITGDEPATVSVTFDGAEWNTVDDEYSGDVVIPEVVEHDNKSYTVTAIGDNAMSGCTGVTSVALPATITSLDDRCFVSTGITEITIPEAVEHIGECAFQFCVSLRTVAIPDAVTTVGDAAFYGCTGLETVTIGTGISSLEDQNGTFNGCTKLSLIICNAATPPTPGTYCFNGIYYLSDIYLIVPCSSADSYSGNATWGQMNIMGRAEVATDDATEVTSATATLNAALVDCGEIVDKGYLWRSAAAAAQNPELPQPYFIFGEGVENIVGWQTSADGQLTGLTPGTEYQFRAYAVAGGIGATCGTIKTLTTLAAATTTTFEASGISYMINLDEESVTVIASEGDPYSGDIIIPSTVEYSSETYTVTAIGNGCFAFTGITEITIPETVIAIGANAFQGCTGLSTVAIPDNVITIGNAAFYGCSSLQTVTIGAGISSLEDVNGTFNGCTALSLIICNAETPPVIDDPCFTNAAPLTDIHLRVPCESVEAYQTDDRWGQMNVRGLVEVASVATGDATEVSDASATLEINVEFTEAECKGTQGCQYRVKNSNDEWSTSADGMLAGLIPETEYEYRAYAQGTTGEPVYGDTKYFATLAITAFEASGIFYKINLDEISVTVIASEDDPYTGDITIPETVEYSSKSYTVTAIGGYAMANCTGVTSVSLPATITLLGERCFVQTGITEITIPESVNAIGECAFQNCKQLLTVAIPDNVTTVDDAAFYGCSSLQTVTIGTGISSLTSSNGIFNGCAALSLIICNATTPPVVNAVDFTGIWPDVDNIRLRVPCEVVDAYKAHAIWGCMDVRGIVKVASVATLDATDVSDYFATLHKAVEFTNGCGEIQGFQYRVTGAPEWLVSADGILTDLTPETSYEYRAYAQGTIGEAEYGETKDFATLAAIARTVTFNAGTGTCDTESLTGTSINLPTATACDGNWTFAGWSEMLVSEAAVAPAPVDNPYLPKREVTLYAVYSNTATYASFPICAGTVTHTVSFVSNGGSEVNTVTLADNDVAVKPADPAKENFAFEGWYSDEALAAPYDFGTPVTADITLYAKWTLIKFSVAGTGSKTIWYRITSDDEVEVSFGGAEWDTEAGEYDGAIAIPETVTYEGLTYTVTAVGDNAFRESAGEGEVTSVTLPVTITRIGAYAFAGQLFTSFTIPAAVTEIGDYALDGSVLTEVICWAVTPPYIYYAFGDGYSDAVLYVPCASQADYIADVDEWAWYFYSGYIDGIPEVATDDATNVTTTTATLSKAVSDCATVTAEGYLWRSAAAATAAPAAPYFAADEEVNAEGWTISADGLLTGLTAGAEYQYRAYATVAIGTAYGAVKIFTTASYTVTFESNGGSEVPSQSVDHNGKATEPTPPPTKDGNTFAGWHTKFDNIWTFAVDVVTSDTTLYARWIDTTTILYTVTFKSNGDTLSTQKVPENEMAGQVTPPTRVGYAFGGWYSDETFAALYDFDTPVTTDVTLYAKWTVNTYRVAFNSDGGSAVDTATVSYNGNVPEPSAPTKAGNTFASWYSDEDLAAPYDFGTPVTADITLYAKWTVNTYRVAFNSDGGSAVDTATVSYNDHVPEPPTPTKDGYDFGGWYSNADATSAWDFGAGTVTGDTTLYAKWTKLPTGVKRYSLGAARVYPNPATGIVAIESEEGEEVLLYTLSGVLLKRTHGNRLDLSGYPGGLYLLRTGSKAAMLVKQ